MSYASYYKMYSGFEPPPAPPPPTSFSLDNFFPVSFPQPTIIGYSSLSRSRESSIIIGKGRKFFPQIFTVHISDGGEKILR